MAVGSDMTRPAPQRSRAPASLSSRQQDNPNGWRSLAVNDAAVADVANNQRASGVGAGLATLRGMDRAGISRGKGQRHMADMAEAAGIEEGNAAAAQTESSAGSANRDAAMTYRNTMKNERLSDAGLLERLRSAQSGERLARQGFNQDLNEARRRGRFQLDSLYLDTTPLLNNLLS